MWNCVKSQHRLITISGTTLTKEMQNSTVINSSFISESSNTAIHAVLDKKIDLRNVTLTKYVRKSSCTLKFIFKSFIPKCSKCTSHWETISSPVWVRPHRNIYYRGAETVKFNNNLFSLHYTKDILKKTLKRKEKLKELDMNLLCNAVYCQLQYSKKKNSILCQIALQ